MFVFLVAVVEVNVLQIPADVASEQIPVATRQTDGHRLPRGMTSCDNQRIVDQIDKSGAGFLKVVINGLNTIISWVDDNKR